MRLRTLAFLLAGLSCACGRGTEIPPVDLRIRVDTGVTEVVELGRGFPLAVSRIWRKDWAPAAWDDGALAPLVLRLQGVDRREDGARVEETRRYLAYAFTLQDVKTPRPRLVARPKTGGPPQVVETDAVRVRVIPALDPAAPGDAELPGGMRAEPMPWTPWAIAALALVGGLAWGLRRARRRLRGDLTGDLDADAATPRLAVRDRLRQIRARSPEGVEALRSDFVEVADLLRDAVAGSVAPDARRRTTEEVLAEPAVAGLERHRELSRVLVCGDGVKFAAHEPTSDERDALLDDAEAFADEPPRAST